MALAAGYFDGVTSRRHRVVLVVEDGIAIVSGDVERRSPLAGLRVSEASRHGPRIVTFPDGAHLEIEDTAAFAQLLASTGHRDALVERLQQSWRATLLAGAGMAVALLLLWRYALPVAAELLAAAVPVSVEQALGASALQTLDRQWLSPSTLLPAAQEKISTQFARLTQTPSQPPRYRRR